LCHSNNRFAIEIEIILIANLFVIAKLINIISISMANHLAKNIFKTSILDNEVRVMRVFILWTMKVEENV